MEDRQPGPEIFLADHVHRVLARAPQMREFGVDITVAAHEERLVGTCPTLGWQVVASHSVWELSPRHEVRDETANRPFAEPARLEPRP